MRGAPLIESLVAFFALLLLALPIRGLTSHSHSSTPAKPVVTAPQHRPVHLEIVGTAEAFEFQVNYLGSPIWSGIGRRSPVATDVQLPVPKEGVDLELTARFGDSTLHALRLTLALDDGAQAERSVWGTADVDEVLTFQPTAY